MPRRVWLIFLGAVACGDVKRESPQSIHLSEEVALRSSGDTADVTWTTNVIAARSKWYVAYPIGSTRGFLGLYDSAGALKRIFLPSGRGPGEVPTTQGQPEINGIGFGPADTLYLLSNGLVHLFSPPPTAAFVRTVPFQKHMWVRAAPFGFVSQPIKLAARLAPGVATSTGMVTRPPAAYDWSGRELTRFGEMRGDLPDDESFGAIAPVDSMHLWMSAHRRYELRLLGPGGHVMRRLKREVPWFPPDSTMRGMPWSTRPIARILSMRASDSTIWVLIQRAHREWKPLSLPTPPLDKPILPQLLPSFPRAKVFENVLEVLDARDGRLIASHELPGDFSGFTPDGLLVQDEEDESGFVTIRVFRVGLKRTP